MDLSDRLIRLAYIPSVVTDVSYRGCSTSTLRPSGATLSSADERVLRRAQKIMERLRVDTSPIKEAILKYGM